METEKKKKPFLGLELKSKDEKKNDRLNKCDLKLLKDVKLFKRMETIKQDCVIEHPHFHL